MDLLDIIKERPLTEPHTGFGTCPYCESNDVCVTNRTTTLLGFSGPVDPNQLIREMVIRTYPWWGIG